MLIVDPWVYHRKTDLKFNLLENENDIVGNIYKECLDVIENEICMRMDDIKCVSKEWGVERRFTHRDFSYHKMIVISHIIK